MSDKCVLWLLKSLSLNFPIGRNNSYPLYTVHTTIPTWQWDWMTYIIREDSKRGDAESVSSVVNHPGCLKILPGQDAIAMLVALVFAMLGLGGDNVAWMAVSVR